MGNISGHLLEFIKVKNKTVTSVHQVKSQLTFHSKKVNSTELSGNKRLLLMSITCLIVKINLCQIKPQDLVRLDDHNN